MRRWELVEGTASKFWETGAVGATVTVRYGRCGSEGRTRTKEYASEEAAHAQVRRTVAEKERRGYEQVVASASGADGATDTDGATRADGATGTGGAVGAALPDETTFRLPLSWRRVLHPRRGGCARPLSTADEEASARVGERIAGEAAWIELILAEPGSDPELVEATRAHLAGSPSPAGAAALAAVVSVEGAPACWVDTWVAEHGLPFAARAAQELQTIKAHSYHALGRRVKGALKRVSLSSPLHWHHGSLNVAARARAHIAAADEETYLATVAALARARRDSHQRITAAFLAPSETEWVEALLSEPAVLAEDHYVLQRMVLSSLTSADQLARLPYRPDPTLSVIATLADGIGTGVAPMLGTYLDHGHHYAEGVKAVSAALTELPTDEAFAILLHHKELKHVRAALLDAMRRYPVRALRLLAADVRHSAPTRSRASRQLLHAHINTHRPLVAALLPTLPAGAAEVVGPLLNPVSRFPEASAASLPAALTRPPWTRARAGAAAAPVDTGAAELPAPELCWLPGEQEAWARCSTWYTRPQHDGDWEKVISSPLEGLDSTGLRPAWIFLHAPVERITPALATWAPTDLWDGADTLRPVVARFGLGALPLLLRTVPRQPSTMAALFLPFADVTVARHMADWAARLKSTAATTRTWFARHGAAAAAFLVPDAVGKPGAARRAAEQALIQIAAVHGEKTVRDAAARYGAQAVRSVDVLLVTDPLERALPAKLPVLPNWAEPGLLPQLLTRTGEALPAEVVRTALTMFALSRPGEVYPGVGALRDATDPASLAAFGWAVFEQWLDARLPAKESWALYVLGEVGDDETVRRLTPVVRAWPGEGAHHRAVEGLDVLAAIGSETALLHLHGIGQRVRFKALKTRAQEKIAEVAAALGLSSEQLSDRLVPDFGLDPDGSLVVDFGPRRFTVGFDERLAPYVVDASGRRLRDLPAPAAGDDQESASAGRERFVTLRRDVRTIAAGQVHRLETAMVSGRSWTTEEFRDLFVTHPLVGHPVRRLVWQSASRGTVTAFRVTADGAFADAGGGPLVLPADASVRIAHPLRLGGARAEWSEALSRLGLAQPFPQLERVVRSLTDEERTSDRLHRFEGLTVPTAAVLGLERRGWEPGAPGDAGVRGWISKRLGEDVYLVVCLHEGVVAGSPESFPEQRLEAVRLSDRPGAPRPRGPHRPLFGCLDPVTASEVLADLTALAGVRRSPAGGGPAGAPGRTVAAAGQGRSR
ncbi:DUF4132 domain-containing protein [Streptomyces sp. AM 2-1-1]|uniref:WGR and DUF4132 domain-containing protein n=1 Tax=Streptomyces sp. AM 2-1-1 TaxID=3028709 RepID=UPI0023B8AC53|nr:DUF4132 domain-containing protein [Streptomyces sp. AM 2-1-1]WEH43557.1 DUF4132 domain-containing protein [Streptomyces sp. AM 2-1-1]